jgi:hypothetical protein
LRMDPVDRDRFNYVTEVVLEIGGMRIAGVLTATVDARLRPRRIELRRAVRRPDGQSVTQHETCVVEADKIIITREGRPGPSTETKVLPKESFFFSADFLLVRADLSRVKEPFALRDINPQTGEARLLVFRPSTGEDGTRELRSLVDDKTPEAIYRFDKTGRLASWSEAGAPVVMTPVDETKGQALRKRFGPPATQPTTTASE